MSSDHVDAVFPGIEARNLEGRVFKLPADFEADWNVVLIAFQQWHQNLVDSWMPFLGQLQASYPALCVYEMPTISNLYSLARPFIDGGMAAAIRSKQVRERTLTVYTNLANVVRPLQIASTETITLVLVDRAGRVGWRCIGGYTVDQATSLEREVVHAFAQAGAGS